MVNPGERDLEKSAAVDFPMGVGGVAGLTSWLLGLPLVCRVERLTDFIIFCRCGGWGGVVLGK